MKQTYIAYDGINYKIGTSINSENRIKNCKTANPNIELIAFGYGISESKLHLEYSEKRVDREWFDLNELDVNYILKELKKPKQIKEMKNIKEEFTGITKRLNDIFDYYNMNKYSDFSERTGLSHQVCSNYLKGKQKPDAEKLSVIINAFKDINADWLITGNGVITSKEDCNSKYELVDFTPLEITEYVAKNIDVFKNLELFKILVEMNFNKSLTDKISDIEKSK